MEGHARAGGKLRMTGCLRLALAIHIHQPIGNFEGVFEDAYRDSYAALYRSHQQLPASPRLAAHLRQPAGMAG